MDTYDKIIKGLSRFMYWIAGAALTAIVFLTVSDVILRLFKQPILGTYEIVSLLGAVVIGFAIPQTSIDRGQVLMDFFYRPAFLSTPTGSSYSDPPFGYHHLPDYWLEFDGHG